jgi:Rap1a immunity proteins
MKLFLLAALLMTASGQVATAAVYETGNKLLEHCRGGDFLLYCMGYIVGVVDDFEISLAVLHKPPCLPTTVTQGQIKDVVVNYLVAHPEHRDWTAAPLVRTAVVQAWGCK